MKALRRRLAKVHFFTKKILGCSYDLSSPPRKRGRECTSSVDTVQRRAPAQAGNVLGESPHLAAPSVNAVSITSPNGCHDRPSNCTSRICLIGR